MLEDETIARLKKQFKREADLASARGAAEQCGFLDTFEFAMQQEPGLDPWQLVRDLIDVS